VNIISKDWIAFWREFFSGHFKSLSRYFPVKNNERRKISSVNLLGVFEKIKTPYFCIIFWIVTTTPLFLVDIEGFENHSY
jgi:hypothetical protein